MKNVYLGGVLSVQAFSSALALTSVGKSYSNINYFLQQNFIEEQKEVLSIF